MPECLLVYLGKVLPTQIGPLENTETVTTQDLHICIYAYIIYIYIYMHIGDFGISCTVSHS